MRGWGGRECGCCDRGAVVVVYPRGGCSVFRNAHHTYIKRNHHHDKQGLRIALTGRDETGLEPLMAFLARYVTHPDFADTLSDAAHVVLGALRHCRGVRVRVWIWL